jgi:peptidylprolyl isomerase
MRITRLALVAALVLGLAACGDSSVDTASKDGKPADQAATGTKASEATPAAPAPAAPQAAAPPAAAPAPAPGESRTLVMELKGGKVAIELRPDLAPKHVERIRTLTKQGFYNGLKFHRVIDGFMAQTGDPTGTGMGGSELSNLPAEFTSTPFQRGTVGAARARDPNSANSQFFICFNDTGCKSLVGNYTVFGKVTSGMDYVDQIKKGDRNNGGTVSNPDTIVKMYLQ